ncbi:MAG: helix-hairpin-helix domain-containing protein [Proteobacteria bacterium]|nr:helix-hairpin-helix domain-containing protein [Pseudomonadota bacterium]
MKIVDTFSSILSALFLVGVAHANVATQPTFQNTEASKPVAVQSQSVKADQVTETVKVNLNTADAKTLAHVIKGIGLKRAEAIVAFREKNGSFKSIDDLVKVRQISPKFIEKNHKELEEKFTVGEVQA